MLLRHLYDWAFTRIFWLCLFWLGFLGGKSKADVILWESVPTSGQISFTQLTGGQIRSQEIDLEGPAIATSINLNTFQPAWFLGTGGPSQISLWLDSTPAERRTLVYTGSFKSSWTNLALELPKGRSYLSLENLPGSQTIVWNQQIESNGTLSRFYGSVRGTPVPEPEMVGLLVIWCLAGIASKVLVDWKKRRDKSADESELDGCVPDSAEATPEPGGDYQLGLYANAVVELDACVEMWFIENDYRHGFTPEETVWRWRDHVSYSKGRAQGERNDD